MEHDLTNGKYWTHTFPSERDVALARILEINKSADRDWLERFATKSLLEYLERIEE